MVEGCQGAHSSELARIAENVAEHTVEITNALAAQLAISLSANSV
jgi:hypothetical protein